MGYSRETYDRAIEILSTRKQHAETETQRRKEIFFERCPRALEIQRQLSSTACLTARTVLKGANVSSSIRTLKERNLALQKERADLLVKNGFPLDFLTTHYQCSLCSDTGFQDGKMCKCLKKLLRKIEYDRLNMSAPLTESTFEKLSLEYYPTEYRENMNAILQYAKEYADKFSATSNSLFFCGGTGLGKTHLSLAIANVVLQNGFGVIYTTAQNMAQTLDNERFAGDASVLSPHFTACDLLIIDDLGTEYTTSYVTASIYNIINTRLLKNKPTIISTNLTPKELENHYSSRLISRIIGNYSWFTFLGKDIRQQKRIQSPKRWL